MEVLGAVFFFFICVFGITFLMLFALSARYNLSFWQCCKETFLFFWDMIKDFFAKIKEIFKKGIKKC